jgi:predicted outer membrane repeat protein
LIIENTRDENSYHVVTAIDCNHTAVIDGFTITAGNASGAEYEDQRGGGIYGGCPTVSNCKIMANTALNSGGGVWGSYYSVEAGIVRGSLISGNAAGSVGGIEFSRIADCIVRNNCATVQGSGAALIAYAADCTFENNSTVGNGGVMAAWNDSPKFIRCTFTGNSAGLAGGVLHVDGCSTCSDSYPYFQQCAFYGNSAEGEGGVAYSTSNSSINFINCILTENSSNYGGGAIFDVSYFGGTLINCTISRNSAPGYGAGVFVDTESYWYNDAFTITNCILWNNCTSDHPPTCYEEAQICVDGPFIGLNIDYSCVQDWTGLLGGDGNTSANPRFEDIDDNAPFRLAEDSPCIDAGDNSALLATVLFDIEGKDRFIDDPNTPDTGYGHRPIIDMGAHESSRRDFLLSTQDLDIPEGATVAFTVALAARPAGAVNVTVFAEPNDPDITVQSGHSVLFDHDNYAQPQTVVLAASEDEDYFDGRTVVRISAPGLVTAILIANEIDSDPAPAILYVDAAAKGQANGATWHDAFPNLQGALDLAALRAEVTQIRVASGRYNPYRPNEHRQATFDLAPGIAVYGGFPPGGGDWKDRDPNTNVTILSGDLNGDDQDRNNSNDNCYHVVTALQADANAILDGFLITGGNANGNRRKNQTLGAAIYNYDATIRNCTISRNYAYDYGAGTYNYQGLTENCLFTENTARLGAGMLITGPDYEDIATTTRGCTFAYNHAQGVYCAGGAIFSDRYSATIIDCNFTENHIEGYWARGGAVFTNDRTEPNIINCAFTDNSVAGQLASGGALHIDYKSEAHVTDCIFTANQAPKGGAIANDTGATLTNCVFTENRASEGNGGAITGYADSIEDCIFIENSAKDHGGAVYIGARDVSNCVFMGNTALAGGAYRTFFSSGETKFTDCLFSGNSAQRWGGAIYESSSRTPIYLFNTTVSGNYAGEDGGGLYKPASNITVYNSILWGNRARHGQQIFYGDPASLNISYSNIEGGWVGAGNIDHAPCFVRDPNDGGDGWSVGDNDDFGDLRLRPESPCIDAGNNELHNQETHRRLTILDGDCNDTAVIDMGAFEFDFTELGDLARDCRVDAADYALFAQRWADTPCNQDNSLCGLADMDRRNSVDFPDLLILVENWLATTR